MEASPEDAGRGSCTRPRRAPRPRRAFGGGCLEIAESRGGTLAPGRPRRGLILLDLARPADALIQLEDEDIESDPPSAITLCSPAPSAPIVSGPFASAADAYRDGAASRPRVRAAAWPCCAARNHTLSADSDRSGAELNEVLISCDGSQPPALLQLIEVYEKKEDRRAAATCRGNAVPRLPRDDGGVEIRAAAFGLAAFLPPTTQDQRDTRDGTRALKLFEAGRFKDAAAVLLPLVTRKPPAADVRHLSGAAGGGPCSPQQGEAGLCGAPGGGPGSPAAAEAAYFIARPAPAARGRRPSCTTVVERFAGTPWAEEALTDRAPLLPEGRPGRRSPPYFPAPRPQYPRARTSTPRRGASPG